MVQIPTGETKPEGGGGIDADCDCHFVIEGYEDFSQDGSPRLVFDFVVLASTDPNQVGKKRKGESFSLNANAAGRLLELACAVGLYSKPQWKADKEAGVDPDIPYQDSVGCQLCSQVHMKPFDSKYWQGRLDKAAAAGDTADVEKCQSQIEKNGGRSFAQLGGKSGFTFWAIGDKEADHVPLDQEMIAAFPGGMLPTKTGELRKRPVAGQGGGSGGAAGGTAGQGAKLPPKTPGSNGNGAKPPASNPTRQTAPQAKTPAPAAAGSSLW